ncbi:MAG TPA: site-2 protease family protein, partial [Nitrospiria bacterium]|nr:site-2 protease family protein [Nitrospiria bacterium]
MAARFLGIRVLKFSIGFGPKIFGRKVGDTEYLVSALPLGGYVKMFGEEPEEEGKTSESMEAKLTGEGSGEEAGEQKPLTPEEKACAFSHQPVWKRIIVVVAGPAFNMILAYLIFAAALAVGMAMYVPSFDSLMAEVEQVIDDGPAKAAGVLPGDRVIAIDGKTISTWAEMVSIVDQSAGKELSFLIERGDSTVKIAITPEATEYEGPEGEMLTGGRIGIGKNPRGVEITADNILQAAYKGLHATWAWTY